MKKICCFLTVSMMTLMSLASTDALASHYDLADVSILAPDVQEKLIRAGVETTEDLLDSVLTPSARASFSQKYGMSAVEVEKLAHKLELMQVVGIGPKAADLLMQAGVKNLQGLAGADPNALLEVLLATNRQYAITGVQPDMTVVKDWIDKARKISKHVS